jgi:exopolysaccharide production protein ExoY
MSDYSFDFANGSKKIDRLAVKTADVLPVRPSFGLYFSVGKRALDLVLVIATLPFWVSLVAVLSVLVAFDGGAPLYAQKRVGKGGRVFTMWKLRSMVKNADQRLEAYLATNPEARAEWDSTQKLRDDPRVTLFGRIMRKTSLDELPQIWNVLKGDMSLVGPRPMMLEQQALYPGLAYYKLRPGITGNWQITDRNKTTFAARAEYDRDYAATVSLGADVGILAKTVRVVLNGTGC